METPLKEFKYWTESLKNSIYFKMRDIDKLLLEHNLKDQMDKVIENEEVFVYGDVIVCSKLEYTDNGHKEVVLGYEDNELRLYICGWNIIEQDLSIDELVFLDNNFDILERLKEELEKIKDSIKNNILYLNYKED